MRYKLNAEQQMKASQVGQIRAQRYFPQFAEEYNRKEDNPGDWKRMKGNFFEFCQLQMESIAAEMVVGEYLGLDYGDLGDERFKAKADVGANIEVKWTRYAEGSLIVVPRDRSSDIAILVTGSCPSYTIQGWIPISIAKSDRYKSSRDASWWVGQIHLRPIETFKKSSYAEASLSNL
jgi:hypothetical protein